jgi:ADP-ribosylglycohydrolase/uncharacterized protein (DUF1810 family)
MLGAIIGDTVGSVYEFHNTKNYGFEFFQHRSAYTDDSVMTMAVAYWLLTDKEHTYQGLEDIMVEFGNSCPCPMGGYGGGFSTWLFSPQELYSYDEQYGAAPYESATGRHPYGSWGNGSAMRASALGWFFDTLEETERVAAISAASTHNHPEGIKGAQATAAAIFLARTGKTKEEIRDYIEKTYGYDLHKTWEYWHPRYQWDSSCQGTVPQAIIAFLDSDNFEDAIRKAVSLGGDSDTLACITGGIAEAYYKALPGWIVDRTRKPFPKNFDNILDAVRKTTVYGETVRIDEQAKPIVDNTDPYELRRFEIAHANGAYEAALKEINNGKKVNHWIWYIFPQIQGLGHSMNAVYYGISCLAEAKAYLAHPVLGLHLRAATLALFPHKGKDIRGIMGSEIDALKLRSCMTLFSQVSPGDIYGKVLDDFFDGEMDKLTLNLLTEKGEL